MRRLLAATETVAALFLLLIALVTASNVGLRGLFSIQLPDWFDGSRMLQGIALFWGFALATYYGSHICVDVLWEHVSRARQRWIDIVATTLTLLFLAPLAWMVWVKVGGTGTQGTMDLRLPLKWFYVVSAAGATMAAVLCGLRLVRLLQRADEALRPVSVDDIETGRA